MFGKCGSLIAKGVQIFKRTVQWGREVATGQDGMGSASRVVVLLVSTTVCIALLAHVKMNHGLPQADQMYGLSAMLAAGAGAYATNKIRRDSNGGDSNAGQPQDPNQAQNPNQVVPPTGGK